MEATPPSPRALRAKWLALALFVALTFGAGALGAALLAPTPADDTATGAPRLLIGGGRILESTAADGHVTLRLDEAARLGGFLDGRDLAPGDLVRGTLLVDTNVAVGAPAFSFAMRIEGVGPGGLADALLVESFLWGSLDALHDGAPTLLERVDAPGPDNATPDGRASLRELAGAPIALPPPRPLAEGGTRLDLAFRFDPPPEADADTLAGEGLLDLTFVFELVETPVAPPPAAPAPTPPPTDEAPAAPPTSVLDATPARPDGLDGWYRTSPRLALATTPADADALVRVDDGPEAAYVAPFTLADGRHEIAHRARLGDGTLGETTRASFAVDTRAPALVDAALAPAQLALGSATTVRVTLADAASGVAGAWIVLVAPDGASLESALVRSGDAWTGAATPAAPGPHAAHLVARDAAGHEATFALGSIEVVVPHGLGPIGGDGEVLESTSIGGGTLPGAVVVGGEPQPSEPRLLLRERGEPRRAGEGVSGPVEVALQGAAPRGALTLVVTPLPQGEGGWSNPVPDGAALEWDTTDVPNGYYRLEMREDDPSAPEGYRVLAESTVLVLHPRGTPTQATLAVVAGAVITLVGAALSTSSAGALARTFDVFGFFQDAGSSVAEDRFRDSTKHLAALHRRKRIRSAIALAVAVTLLGVFFTFEGLDAGWSLQAYVESLPLVGAAAVVFALVNFGSEILIARLSGALTRFRLLVSGTLSLAVSGILLRQCFGHAGYIDKDEIGDDSGLEQRRLAALRAISVYGAVLAATVVFLAAGRLWRFDFAEWGLAMALTALATSTMPVRPLPGSEVWDWNKPVALLACAAAVAAYVLFTTGHLGLDVLAGAGIVGGAGYGLALWKLRLAKSADRTPHDDATDA